MPVKVKLNFTHPKCDVCGAAVPENSPAICRACKNDPEKVILYLLKIAEQEKNDTQQIAGYRYIRKLGYGSMGAVCLVEKIKTGQQMALKLMFPDAAVNEHAKQLFLCEAYNACQLKHPNVVKHLKCGRSGDIYFILMELCSGGSVDTLMKKMYCNKKSIELDIRNLNERIDLATRIILQVLDGLEYAHQVPVVVKFPSGQTIEARGIVHRDFKPGNIFLSEPSSRFVAKVADFGLAHAFQLAGLTKDTFAGAPMFIQRQQIFNFRYGKPDVDVWAAAASYYNMITGHFPQNFIGYSALFDTTPCVNAVPILNRDPRIPKKLAKVIDTALSVRPDIGIQTAAELKNAIKNAL